MKKIIQVIFILFVAGQLAGCGYVEKFVRHPFSFWKEHPEDQTLFIPEGGGGDTGPIFYPLGDTPVIVVGPAAMEAEAEAEAAPAAPAAVTAAETVPRPAAAAVSDTRTPPRATTPPRPAATTARDTRPARPTTPAPPPRTTTFRSLTNNAFKVGEKLTYSMKYLGMTGGTITMSVAEIVNRNNRPAYHIVLEAKTARGIEWIYRVNDRLESFLDVAGLFSWRYEKHINESRETKDEIFDFDQTNHLLRKNGGNPEIIPEYCQDVLSSLYYVRAQRLEVGRKFVVPVNDGKKTYDMVVSVIKREVIELGGTQFTCLQVTPLLKFQGVFRSRGEMNIWVTDDERHIPLLMKSQIALGSFVAELTGVQIQ